MISARTAIRQGFRLARRSRSAVWILFGANMLLALVAGLPIYHGILSFTSHSLMHRRLLTGFSVSWLTDFAFHRHGALQQYAEVIMALGLVALPVNAVLAGGVLSRFQRQTERFRLSVFFRDCGRYTGRMLLLMLIALFGYWAVFKYVNVWLGNYVNHVTLYWGDDRMAFLAHLGAALLVIVALVLVNLVIDFAQVRIVFGEGAGAVESFLASLGFAIARLPRAIVVYAIPSLCGLALLGVYRLVTPWHMIHLALASGPTPSYRNSLVLALLFIGQQLVMFGRYWFRVATWGSEWSLFAGTRPPAKAPNEAGQPAVTA